ncbi:MORN repeat-containing protein [Sediminicoccus rosea]|jgi:hypothetical protein|uniref:MORN repeat-containing protein n=1 Tax=Sediminicoccus rosea TaxID=1225128 RepID=A0ABZ0PHK6_9PROT|nr:hypothetical protein [Sediminicoccus rosea]WPB84941.1 hypothetical protein R9Z33_22975 [Sediminicoccus rosea]
MRWMFLILALSGPALLGTAAAQAPAPEPAHPRPAPPAADVIAEVGRPGWTVDERNGCWVWNPNPQQQEIVIWTGPCEGGPAQGEGMLEWRYVEGGEPRGERYVGSLARGKMHGIGTFLDSNGIVYQGEWQEGREQGRGLRVWATARYEGEWREGRRHGRGIMVWINGNLYRGEFRDDRPEGLGEYFSVEGGWFRGAWLAGCFREGDRQAAIGRPLEECP